MPQGLSRAGPSAPLHRPVRSPLRPLTLGRRLADATSWPPAQDWRRLLGAIRQGLATHGAAAAAHEQYATVRALRSGQTRPRTIAVIGSNGGVGTTTTAALLGSVLAAARDDQTLLLTVHSDASDVAVRLAVAHAPSVTEVLAGLRRHGRIPPTPVTRTRLRVLASPPPGSADVDSGLGALLDVATSGHASVVVDAGVASRVRDLAGLAELFDTVLLVCGTATDAIEARNTVIARWRAECRPPTGTRLILVSIPTRAGAGGPGNDPVEWLSAGVATIHAMAHDPELGRGRPIDLRRVSGPTLTATLILGADIMRHR